MIVKTAWKNIWRNKTRSAVVIFSVVLGVVGGLFIMAFMSGWADQRIYSALDYELSHVEISEPDFRKNYEAAYTIKDLNRLSETLDTLSHVEAWSYELQVMGMAAHASKRTGLQIIGIDPENERNVSKIHKSIIEGTGDYEQLNKKKILIGEEMARKLNLIHYIVRDWHLDSLQKRFPEQDLTFLKTLVGKRFTNEKVFKNRIEALLEKNAALNLEYDLLNLSRVYKNRNKVIISLMDVDSNQVSEAFRIAGIYSINNDMFEGMNAFVNIDELYRITGIPKGQCHRISIRITDNDVLESTADAIGALCGKERTQTWKEIQPELSMMTEMMVFFFNIFMIIILAAIAFGIINTMLMAVLERTKEIGMLMAIGMAKKKIFNMIMFESILLTFSGGLLGMVLGKIIITFSGHTGIDLSAFGEGMEAMGFATFVYPKIPDLLYLNIAVLIIMTGALSAIYPAIKALKLNPSEALKTD